MNTGLFILRQIDPSPALMDRLVELNQLFVFDDNTTWVDDRQPRDPEYTQEIVDTATKGWGIFDDDWNLHGRYRSLDRAQKALEAARPVITTDVEFDEDVTPDED